MNELKMEDWMAVISILSIAFFNFAYLKFKATSTYNEQQAMKKLLAELKQFKDANEPLLMHLTRAENRYDTELKGLQKAMMRLETKMEYQMTPKEAQSIFATKDELRQIEAHLKTIERLIRAKND